MKKFTNEEIVVQLKEVKEWRLVNKAIERKFEFTDFVHAMGFIVQVGLLAEKNNHHPELWNVYNKVSIRLNTHDADGITGKDFDLAKAIDKL